MLTQVVKVASVQMTSSADVAQNLQMAEQGVRQAAAQGAHLVALPEYFPLLHPDEQEKQRVAEVYQQGPMQTRLGQLAAELGIYLVAGSLPLVSEQVGKVYNTCLVFDPQGVCIHHYHKMHLFSYQGAKETYDEGRSICAGNQVQALELPWGRVGIGICYDLRFPEFFRQLQDIDLWIIPAAFTVPTGRAHWHLLLRARAVENQAYVLAAAQTGCHAGGRLTYGHSMLVDPWGEVVAELAEEPNVLVGEIDPQRLQEVRQQLPALAHRRLF